MTNEFKKPNMERGEAGFDRDELLSEVIPGENTQESPAELGEQHSEPIRSYELPTRTPEPGDGLHHEIPGLPLPERLSEKDAIRKVNEMLGGKFDDPSEVADFLSSQMEGQE